MVWQKQLRSFVCVCCMCAAMLALPAAAHAAPYAVYDGNMSSTYVTIFRDMIGKIGILEDYVFFRSGQFEYVLIAGDLTYEQGLFSAPAATEYKITVRNDYSSQYVLSQGDISDFMFSPGSNMIYSNLGSFPDLVDPGTRYEFALLALGVIALMMFLIRSIFSFTYRGRN